MRLLRRNALGVYAVYAAAIVSGLVVTPIVVRSLGKSGYGVWTFVGAVTIYLSVLDFGVGPAVVRFGAEARGRRSDHDLNEIASTGLALYAGIGALTLPIGIALAWLVPWFAGVHGHHLAWEARITTLLVVLSLALRFPLGLFNNLLVAQQRWDLQNLGNFVS
ncbi:MAG: oligosaccharide flippase family protein, partial [Actinobacteria bacterium]|nr:oligosaccharide flippase family protein [Actinomycetota bacterium]